MCEGGYMDTNKSMTTCFSIMPTQIIRQGKLTQIRVTFFLVFWLCVDSLFTNEASESRCSLSVNVASDSSVAMEPRQHL